MGRVISFEMSSQEPEKAVKFYSEVFGWEASIPNWGYWPVKTGNEVEPGIDGGISEGPEDYPHGTRIMLEVDSLDEAIKKSKLNGAQILRDKMDFDNFYLAYIVDPVGICFGLIENKTEKMSK